MTSFWGWSILVTGEASYRSPAAMPFILDVDLSRPVWVMGVLLAVLVSFNGGDPFGVRYHNVNGVFKVENRFW